MIKNTIPTIGSESRIFYGGAVFALLFAVFVYAFNTWGIAYNTNDDMIFALSSFKYWHETAIEQGRPSFYTIAPFAMFPYLVDNIHYLSLVRVTGLIIFTISFSALLGTLFRNRLLFLLCLMLVPLLWQNTPNGHNLLIAYPFYILARFSIFLGVLVYLVSRVLKDQRFSAYEWILCGLPFGLFFAGEFVLQFYFITTLVILLASQGCIVKAMRDWLFPTTLVYIFMASVVLLFRFYFPSAYDGNANVNFNLNDFARTIWVLSTGLVPGVQVTFSNISERINLADLFLVSTVVFSFLVFFVWLKREILKPDIEKSCFKPLVAIQAFMLAIASFFSPLVLVSLTEKYQNWVLLHGTTNIHYSAFSYFAFVAAFSGVGVWCSKRKVLFVHYLALTVFLIAVIQINNIPVASAQREYYAKWPMVRAAISQVEVLDKEDSSLIELDSNLFMGIPQVNYWTRYARQRLGSKYDFRQNVESDITFNFWRITGLGSYLLVSRKGSVERVIVSGNGLSNGLMLGVLDQNSNLISGGISGLERVSLRRVDSDINGVKIFEPACRVDLDRFIGFQFRRLDLGYLKPEYIDFASGYYGLESHQCFYWRWAEAPATLFIRSIPADKPTLHLSVLSANDAVLTFVLPNKSKEVRFGGGQIKDVYLDLTDSDFPSELRILSSAPSVRLNQADPRYFSFRLLSLNFVSIGENGK